MDENFIRYNIQGLADDMEVNLSTLSSLYSEFFHEMKINIEESKDLCNSKDWWKLQRVIHNIKGISSCLYIEDIYDISNKLDIELKKQAYENALPDITSINNLLISSETDIKEFFKKNGINM
ncbi:MAG TPA: hypothetical protein VIK72_07655 [Clostridiaceae bacterium]